jgi:glutathione S-transferase
VQDVSGKTAFVTGGGSGMGLGIAIACAKAGMNVVLTDLREDALSEAVEAFGAGKAAVLALKLDVTNRAQWEEVADAAERRFGKVHVLALNAGVGVTGPMQQASYKDWDFILSVNVGGVVNGLVALLPRMLAHGEWGRVVVTSSTGGFSAVGGAGLYCTTKFAVAGMLESLATDLKGTAIGASVFFPGPVQTNLAQTTHLVRPAHLRNEAPAPEQPGVRDRRPAPGFDTSVFMTKEEVGERVLNGVRNGDLFIMTHPEFRDGIIARNNALLRAVPSEPINEPRANLVRQFGTLMYNPIYDGQRQVGGDEIRAERKPAQAAAARASVRGDAIQAERQSPMLTLYSFGPGANSLKPLLALYEKKLKFTHRFLDPGKFEQHDDWFKAINPRGQVPALDHDGRIVTESTVICEYLEDAFPDAPALRPKDPFAVAEMRVWTKWVDEYFCWCVSTIGWERMIGPMARGLSDEEFEEKVKRIPIPEQRTKWRNARKGFPKKVLEEEMRKIRVSIARLEARLKESPWLAGAEYTLADVCNFAIANGMERGFADIVNEKATPNLIGWIRRINERPAAKEMFSKVKRENLTARAAR